MDQNAPRHAGVGATETPHRGGFRGCAHATDPIIRENTGLSVQMPGKSNKHRNYMKQNGVELWESRLLLLSILYRRPLSKPEMSNFYLVHAQIHVFPCFYNFKHVNICLFEEIGLQCDLRPSRSVHNDRILIFSVPAFQKQVDVCLFVTMPIQLFHGGSLFSFGCV